MKKTVLRSLLCLVLLLALLAGAVYGVNAFTAPVVAENERLAAEAAAAAEAALLGDSELLYDRADPASSTLEVTADTVQSVYMDGGKETYLLRLSTSEGYSKQPIELTLVIDFEGRIVSLEVNENPDDKELGEDFPLSFAGQDSTLAEVSLVAGVTFTSSAIRSAVNDGFNTLIDNGLFEAAEKSDEQLLIELVPLVYPGIVNKAGALQADEIQGLDGAWTGWKATNGSGSIWFTQEGESLLAVCTAVGGVKVYDPSGADVTASVDAALLDEVAALGAANADDLSEKAVKTLSRMLPEGTEFVPAEVPGHAGSVVAAFTAETEEGTRYAFYARPYGYANEVMDFFYVLDESGTTVAMRVSELILHAEYFSGYTLDEPAYKEGLVGLSADSYTGEQTLITGATMSSDAADAALRDVFEAFGLLTESRG